MLSTCSISTFLLAKSCIQTLEAALPIVYLLNNLHYRHTFLCVLISTIPSSFTFSQMCAHTKTHTLFYTVLKMVVCVGVAFSSTIYPFVSFLLNHIYWSMLTYGRQDLYATDLTAFQRLHFTAFQRLSMNQGNVQRLLSGLRSRKKGKLEMPKQTFLSWIYLYVIIMTI